MSKSIKNVVCVVLTASFVTLATSSLASAQSPVVVNSVTPTVVGYSVEPAGLFSWRTRYRPVVAPVVTPVTVNPVRVQPAPIVTPIAPLNPVTVNPVTVNPMPTVNTAPHVLKPITVPSPVVRYTVPPVVQTYYTPTPVVSPVMYLP